MRILVLLALSFFLTGCLKKEVLNLNTENGNFQETDFYTSGKFEQDLQLTVVNIALDTFQTANGDDRCIPEMELKLKKGYAQELSNYWTDDIRIILFRGFQLSDPREFELGSGNYTSTFNYTHESIECDQSTISIDYRLQLIDPLTGRASAAVDKQLHVATP